MSRAIQRRRGTVAQHSTFTGLAGEITVDTDNSRLRIHDGATPGGKPVGDFVNVLDFGAVGDGVADDTTKIQAAFNTGKDVFVPYGTYLISSTIKTAASGQCIFGQGWNSIIKTTDAALQFGIAVVTGHTDVLICDLKLQGAATGAESIGSQSNGAIGVNTNAGATGFAMSYPTTQAGNCRVHNVWFDQWNTCVSNNLSDGFEMWFCRGTNVVGVSSGYGYGITSSGKYQKIVGNYMEAQGQPQEGAHDGSGNAATLSDSGASWTVNELVGLHVYNRTDGSFGLITANTATTVTATLSGGSDNDWDASDVYVIGTGRHAYYLNGQSESCYVAGNTAKNWLKNPYNFKAQLATYSGFYHTIVDNVAERCNWLEVTRAANFYLVGDASFGGGYCTLRGNKTVDCKGHELRIDWHPHTSVEDFKASRHGAYATQTNNNSPVWLEYSDYSKLKDIRIDGMGATSHSGAILEQCAYVEIDGAWFYDAGNYRAGVTLNAATPDTTNNCSIRNLVAETGGTITFDPLENAAYTSQGIVSNLLFGQNGNEITDYDYTIASAAITVGIGRKVELIPESGTADTLSTINGGVEGQIVSLRSQTGDTITVDGAGNLLLTSSITLDNPADTAVFEKRGSSWCKLSESNNT